MTWTQPLCGECWFEKNPNREPTRIVDEHTQQETCCLCGRKTRAGIYVRVDPRTVPHPTTSDGEN